MGALWRIDFGNESGSPQRVLFPLKKKRPALLLLLIPRSPQGGRPLPFGTPSERKQKTERLGSGKSPSWTFYGQHRVFSHIFVFDMFTNKSSPPITFTIVSVLGTNDGDDIYGQHPQNSSAFLPPPHPPRLCACTCVPIKVIAVVAVAVAVVVAVSSERACYTVVLYPMHDCASFISSVGCVDFLYPLFCDCLVLVV
eukprot:gene9256-1535_t